MARWGCWGFLLLLLLSGCTSTEKSEAPTDSQTLRIALVPSEDAERMVEGFEPIRAAIEKELGVPVTLNKVTDYSSVIEAMRGEHVDVAWYGPLSMVLAHETIGAEPFAIAKLEGKGATYTSLILVPASSKAKALGDLAGKTLALVDPASTSGNLLPRSMIKRATGKSAEELLAKVTYAGSHDAALLALLSGSVDACAIQDVTFEDAMKRGDVKKEDYRVLAQSDPIPQSPFAFRKGLNQELKLKLTLSLLSMHERGIVMDVPGMGKVEKFEGVDFEAYLPIQKMAKELGLSAEQMAG